MILTILFICAILIAFISFVIYSIYYQRNKAKINGQRGEGRIRYLLGETIEGVQYVLNNIMVSDGKNSSQIDHIFINKNGVFVIETKNYSGWIFGKESDREWTQVLSYGNVKNHFYNPVMQNATHIRRIESAIPSGIPIRSIVVFVQGNIENIISGHVYNLKQLNIALKTPLERTLTEEEMKTVYDNLCKMDCSAIISEEQHIAEIQKMKSDIDNNICPRCGARLVLKQNNKGQYFYGCSNYPSCRFHKSYRA